MTETKSCIEKVSIKPALGWNSYDCFGWSATENEIKQNAAFLAENLKNYGFEYVVLDYLWAYDGRGKEWPNPDLDFSKENSVNKLSMDEYGRLIPDLKRFPSSKNGNGLKPLGDYIHSLGLKFGLHLMRGIPRAAVMKKLPVWGTDDVTADKITSYDTCFWLNHMYGLDMKKPNAQQYINSIFMLYAEWGVDYIKLDDAAYPYKKAEVEGYRKAIDNSGRDMILSLSPGPAPLEEAEHLASVANSWRIKGDLWDSWHHIRDTIILANKWIPYVKPSHFPDCDMIPIGRLQMTADEIGRESRLSAPEEESFMTLLAMSRSPMMIGANLPLTNPEKVDKYYKNPTLIQINQQSYNNASTLSANRKSVIFTAELDQYTCIAVFNLKNHLAKTIKITAEYGAKELWSNKTVANGKLSVRIAPHGVGLFIVPKKND